MQPRCLNLPKPFGCPDPIHFSTQWFTNPGLDWTVRQLWKISEIVFEEPSLLFPRKTWMARTEAHSASHLTLIKAWCREGDLHWHPSCIFPYPFAKLIFPREKEPSSPATVTKVSNSPCIKYDKAGEPPCLTALLRKEPFLPLKYKMKWND